MGRSDKGHRLKIGRPRESEARRARGRGRLLKAIGILVVAAFAAGLLAYLPPGQHLRDLATGGSTAGPRTAVIVDQLSLSQPNPDFAVSARGLLEQAGYAVDYYPGEQVTVDFYRNLPKHGYDLIVLRVHSGITKEIDAVTGEETKTEYVSLFTGEPYDEKKHQYPEERLNSLGKAEYYPGAPPLFGIAPDFIKYSMRGNFGKALIILMGCDGLRSQTTAQAFLDKGASGFVSWSDRVSPSHTDAATEHLLRHLLLDGLAAPEAVARTMAEVGPDPDYASTLLYYP